MPMRFHDGLLAQPDVLERSAQAVKDALGDVPPLKEGALVALVGIGASEHIARSAAVTWRAAGIRAVAVSASELMGGAGSFADVYVALSESGRSAETVAALSHLTARRVGVTNDPASPLADVVDEVVPLASGPDSPIYTTGYTATLQAVGLLGDHWGRTATDWSFLPGQASEVLDVCGSVVKEVRQRFDEARIVDVVGSGTSTATAGEGALVLREAARMHTAAHETYNYLHGPMEPLDEHAACLVVGDGRELRLASDVAGIGCATLLLTTRQVEPTENLSVVQLPTATSSLGQAVLQILPVQALAWELASGRGLGVDGFRYRQDDTKLDSP
jgi:fructoselysine-6-P-deglycase FrlB-like protein